MYSFTKHHYRWLFSTLLLILLSHSPLKAQSISLYTPYTKIAVAPGETINYTVDVINKSGGIKSSAITVYGLPETWDYDLKSGGYTLREIAVLPGEKKNLTLTVHVPLKIEKGTYNFGISASGYTRLPLSVTISREGNSQAQFTSKQSNIEGAANSTFTYNAELRNGSSENEAYALSAMTERGWNVIYKAGGKKISSINVGPNQTERITIEVYPPAEIKAGKYKIPIIASSGSISARLELEAAITGTYDLQLTTPTGLLSSKVTAGDDKKIKLLLRNTGSVGIDNIDLKSKAPSNWEVTFEPKKINHLEPGQSEEVYATLEADNKALAGDYQVNFQANSSDARSEASFRISVRTSMLTGWVGLLIILLAAGGVYTLIRKYGRR
ncbi:COG1470 family protein [Sinomicrobium sp.]